MKQALIVLGMHRSGTSAVAGALAHLGGDAPANLMPAHDDNPKGYWESEPVVRLNDQILEAAGSSWHDWRPIDEAWFQSEAADRFVELTAQAIKDEFPGDAPAVLKDPRICRLFPLWRRALLEAGRNPVVLSPLRRPAEVARSLAQRDSFSLGRAYFIWLRHVLEAERASRDTPRILFRWSDFMSDWRAVVSRAQNEAGASLADVDGAIGSAVDEFLDIGLRRQKRDDLASDQAPVWIAPTFEALTTLAAKPDDADARKILDDIRDAFNTTSAIYGPVFEGVQTEYYAFQATLADSIAGVEQRAKKADQARSRIEAALNEERVALTSAREHHDRLAKEYLALNRERHDLSERLVAAEVARLDTEKGWMAERSAAQEMRLVFEEERTRQAIAGAAADARSEMLEDKLVLATRARIDLEAEVARMEIKNLTLEGEVAQTEAECAKIAQERDRLAARAETLQSELSRLLFRRRAHRVRTAWAVLRGREG